MIIIFYTIAVFSLIADEVWNIQHPRINPKKKYYTIQWEKKDFYSYKINNEWVLRKYRKTDDETKRYVRNEYWIKRVNFKK